AAIVRGAGPDKDDQRKGSVNPTRNSHFDLCRPASSETRRPRTEGIPKSETRSRGQPTLPVKKLAYSAFGFRTSFGFRISGFGFDAGNRQNENCCDPTQMLTGKSNTAILPFPGCAKFTAFSSQPLPSRRRFRGLL